MFSHIRSFLAVIEEGSLNRAALRLRISQPTLSRQMQVLESELGARLLERSASGIALTAAGHAFAKRGKKLLTDYGLAVEEVRRFANGEQEQLRIGYLSSAAQTFLNPALARFRKTYPKVRLQLSDLSPGEQIKALKTGEIDLALIGQEGSVIAPDFYHKKLATLPAVVLLPAHHPLAAQKRVSLKSLATEIFVSCPDSDMPGRDRWVAQLCSRIGKFKTRFGPVASGMDHLLTLISSEEICAIVPGYVWNLPTAGIAKLKVAEPAASWDFLVVWQRGRTAGTLHAMVEALAFSFRKDNENS